MNIQHITPEQYVTSCWSGGKTTQLAIAPVGAIYADRSFLWRVSSATVELPESDFTALPDYNRLISTLSGSIVLEHPGKVPVCLKPYEVYAFDGEISTHCTGCCTDFNLMLRKGSCDGSLREFCLRQAEQKRLQLSAGEELLLYCVTGTILCRADYVTVSAGQTLYLQNPQAADGEQVLLEGISDCRCMLAEIRPIEKAEKK